MRRLDQHIRDAQNRIERLHPSNRPLFYASAAERFLPLYQAFSRAERWGDPSLIIASLDRVWSVDSGGPLPSASLDAELRDLLVVTPHADDFDSVETTFAQDVCILVSAALGQADPRQLPVEAAFEVLRVAACVESTGFLDLGDDPRAAAFERQFVSGSLFTQEVSWQEDDFRALERPQPTRRELVASLRSNSRANAYDIEHILPTQRKG